MMLRNTQVTVNVSRLRIHQKRSKDSQCLVCIKTVHSFKIDGILTGRDLQVSSYIET